MNQVGYILINLGLAKGFWVETVCTTTYLINRSSCSSVEFKIPQELWTGKLPNLSHIRVSDCSAYAHQIKVKLDSKAIKCAMLSYPKGGIGYGYWVCKVLRSFVIEI